ncbi:MAG: hypothetical protein FJ284_04370 [Planctomycetes bacterium]|nr:hypothetical protein [Planctomycetota bacterium]
MTPKPSIGTGSPPGGWFGPLVIVVALAVNGAWAGDGTWTGAGGNLLWSTPENWSGNQVADGGGSTGLFDGLDLVADASVALDAPRTLGGLAFGDLGTATPGGWTLTNNGSAANVLTLAGGQPTITVGGLGTGRIAEITAAIAGSAGLVKSGAGQLRLSATNSYTGGTTISGGTLWITADGQLGGAAAITIENGAALRLGNQATGTNTTLAAGRGIVLGAGTQKIIKDTRRTVRIDGVISGTGGLIFDDSTAAGGDGGGGGRYQLYGANTYAGETRIVYRGIKDPGVFLFNKLALQNTTLNYNTTDATGADLLWFSGGITTYTDGFTLGGLKGDKNLNLSPQGNSARNLRIGNNNASTTYTGVISSSNDTQAGITKIGGGMLELTRVHTFAGPTRVEAGVLAITGTGSLNGGSGVTIAGGTLRYTSATSLTKPLTFTSGTIGGTNWAGSLDSVTIAAGRAMAPGVGVGAAATGSQVWDAGGTYAWEMNRALGTAGGPLGWDLVNGTGTLVVMASTADPFRIDLVSLEPGGTAGPVVDFSDQTESTWKIADFGNPIVGFDPASFTVVTSRFANPVTGTFSVTLGSTPGIGGDDTQVFVRYLPGQPVTSLEWYGNGVAAGGSGSWSPSAGTWSNGTVVRTWASSAEARFDSVGGTVTVHPTGVSAGNGISFQADGYYLQGGPVTLSAATAAENVIEVAAAATANLAVPVEGQNGLTKAGLGQLVLASDNGLAGPTSVAAGTLEVASNNALAASPVTVAQGATLFVSPGTTMKSPAVTLAGGTLSANTLAVDGGSGIQVLTIDAGTLAAATALTVGTGGSVDVAEGTRVVVGVDSLSVGSGGLIDLGAGGITVAAGGISATTLRQLILQGRGDGSWTGTEGITSATAAAIAGTRSVGYRVEADGSAFVSFAAPGDVNLDGAVNSLDLVMISASGTFGTGVPSVWSQGDVNYDGVTNTLDLVAISAAGVFGQGNYFPAAPSITPAAVPEPTGLALAVTAALGGLVVSLRARHRRPGRGRIA